MDETVQGVVSTMVAGKITCPVFGLSVGKVGIKETRNKVEIISETHQNGRFLEH